jgi:serine phosphatase RsbU (regulator of sigma subunit)
VTEERVAARLYSLLAALTGASTVEAVADAVLTEGVTALGADGGGMLLATDENQIIVPGAVGYEQVVVDRLRAESPSAELPAAFALRTGQPVWVENEADRDARFPELAGIEEGTASICAVPLEVNGRRIGALRFSFSEAKVFDESERRFVFTLAGQCAQALDRAQQYTTRLEASKRLQRSLLPPELPRIPTLEVAAGYSPLGSGLEIGGDFYDAWQVGDRWAFAIGDVGGSGLETAALTAQVRFTLRALTISTTSPKEVVELLDASLLSSAEAWGDEERFCTAIFGFVSVREAGVTLQMAGGGHPPPVVRRADGRVEELAPLGSLLGMLDEAEVGERTLSLSAGDCLLLFTDGLAEARRDREQFGTERIVETFARAPLDAKGVVAATQQAVLAFSEGSLGDDLAILVFRVRPQ